ncbi:MAG: LytR C-terminal domain-containing protein [Candidatus Krumholzibacteria bacterium]|jgi:hypothetical protein|nr:LytR C-terminal domain-containing protein [Candidatus Krumholzibacteria bacterium]
MTPKRKSRRKKRGFPAAGIAGAVLFIVMALSVYVRWAGVGTREEEEVFEPFQMEVLNGTGEKGIAKEITTQLRRLGIDVLIERNAERFDFRETVLVDRRGNPALMKRLSKQLGCVRVLKQFQDRPEVDVTLVIGWNRDKLVFEDR